MIWLREKRVRRTLSKQRVETTERLFKLCNCRGSVLSSTTLHAKALFKALALASNAGIPCQHSDSLKVVVWSRADIAESLDMPKTNVSERFGQIKKSQNAEEGGLFLACTNIFFPKLKIQVWRIF
ncbi:hypothetical protein CDAR_124721 [Caerostris darwini]|uniref:Uncharacterized protein n=1 Tax=Caerostris darwini TaxID=1538125 RepID=A0AAV4W1B4_9ARAC|nr:hypothetical protein CDAR_124721 [Caerostris darwini]